MTFEPDGFYVLGDDAATSTRRRLAAVGGPLQGKVTVSLHEIRKGHAELVAEDTYRAGSVRSRTSGGKAKLALSLLSEVDEGLIVMGSTYGSNRFLLDHLLRRGLSFATEVRGSELVAESATSRSTSVPAPSLAKVLATAKWERLRISSPVAGKALRFTATWIPGVTPHPTLEGTMFAAQTGGIDGVHRGTIFGFASATDRSLAELVAAIGWARWIRAVVRKSRRVVTSRKELRKLEAAKTSSVLVRANIAIADKQDHRASKLEVSDVNQTELKAKLGGDERRLRVMELFAGAGGMGLGFLLASTKKLGYDIVSSAEVNPIYVETLRRNHATFAKQFGSCAIPECIAPADLRKAAARDRLLSDANCAGGIDILIGGPPCQGFSNANRNSWSSTNPNNALVGVFMRYVDALQPAVFVMENVQGILWTAPGQKGTVGVVDRLAKRMERSGYMVFPKLLDAVWFGVPQYRSRFFLVGISKDLGYKRSDFGEWGPFPRATHGPGTSQPLVTVKAAMKDLPRIGNGESADTAPYSEPSKSALSANPFLAYLRTGADRDTILDHITSRHAAYVIERYKRIPAGGNWKNIADTMSNYANVDRTHSNIYRRLEWDAPSVTIGHYRKSMLVHPSQSRGLSLREAARLQSFPDWFRFSGSPDGGTGGLVHKQQQLANAVCPLVTKALAEYLLAL